MWRATGTGCRAGIKPSVDIDTKAGPEASADAEVGPEAAAETGGETHAVMKLFIVLSEKSVPLDA